MTAPQVVRPEAIRHGFERTSDGGRWNVWAPRAARVELVLVDGNNRRQIPMRAEDDGWFACEQPNVVEGQRYLFRVNDGDERPDPASRWQPDGVHQPSAVFFPNEFAWTDQAWRGLPREELVIYELHVGTFTREGTFDAVIDRLPQLKELGVTCLEIMPVGQFPGRRGWGYDGVYPFAAQASYGGPRGLQRLVNACHAHGLAAMLDVIYNHLGPEGNYSAAFGPYFTDRYHTPWGQAINYDDRGSDDVRRYVCDNVRWWLREFHFDGLRLDAVQTIFDQSPVHILGDIASAAAEEAAAAGRRIDVIAETDQNDIRLIDPPEVGGYGLSGVWSDDFHHSVHALLTGEQHGYYIDYGHADHLVQSLTQYYVYDGRQSRYRGRKHGRPAGAHSGDRFVVSVQNHDQVGNRAIGDRFGTLIDAPRRRTAAGILLLSANVPMLFMGEEYGETNPFPFFCDFGDRGLIAAVHRGRQEECKWFGWTAPIPPPHSELTFASAILSWQWDAPERAGLRHWYRDLLSLRKSDPALRDFVNRRAEWRMGTNGGGVLEWRRSSLTAFFNLGDAPQLIQPPPDQQIILPSESPEYDGKRSSFPAPGEITALPWETLVFSSTPRGPS